MTDKTDKPVATSALTLAALGVVYGDLGTSPLYAFKEAFSGSHGLDPTQGNVFAALSALFWAMTLIVSIKYISVMLRFGNDGEGGVLALTALAHRTAGNAKRWMPWIAAAGIFAAALFYGDAVIAPAIAVLSAVEGLSIATPAFEHLTVPITIGVLTGLFLIQRRGTSAIGKLFGPVMFVWFITLGAFGIISIAQTPEVLNAINPAHAVRFGIEHPFGMFLLMAAVFLSLTGAEALYADMGHFGPKPIRWAWFGLICPGLLLNYFGQGALMLRTHHAGENPFFMLVPLDALLIPMVVLATAATVIASQSTLSGAFSMTQQAMRMGYLPRLYVRHTSDQQRGQIYIPAVNWLLMVSVILLVFLFQSSDHLAAAYGVAVSGTMIITTLLAILVTVIQKPEKRFLLLGFLIVFALLELLFFTANMTKIFSGGWFPLLFGVALFVMLSTWKRGSTLVADYRHKFDIPMDAFIASTLPDVPRVPGTAIYLTADPTLVPSALFHSLKHFKVMHERTVFLHVSIADVPHVSKSERTHMRQPADGIYDVTVKFGFRQETDLPDALKDLEAQGLTLEPMLTTFFVSRANVTEGTHPKMRRWRFSLFAWMTRQSEGAAGFFHLPANQVVELGTKVML